MDKVIAESIETSIKRNFFKNINYFDKIKVYLKDSNKQNHCIKCKNMYHKGKSLNNILTLYQNLVIKDLSPPKLLLK